MIGILKTLKSLFNWVKVKYECPVCEKKLTTSHNPDIIKIYDYPYRDEACRIRQKNCDFCGTFLSVVLFKSGSVKAYDDSWEKVKAEEKKPMEQAEKELETAEDNLDEVETEIENLIDELSEDKTNTEIKQKIKDQKKLLPNLKKKIKAAEKVLNKEERKFELFEDKQDRKNDKWRNKLINSSNK